ncbi:MAG: 2-oxo acid dehydrogenase subunit E2 [Acidobacteriia bacterium]|nr:2-oxo acid dehydrogenase subunit E2 [Terriglobia bacterium]
MALTRIIMPKTGAEMEEGRILAWRKQEGERIEQGEILLEIETDKATMEVEANASGLLLKRLYREGDAVPATRLIAVLGEGNESEEEVQGLIRTEGQTPLNSTLAASPPAVHATSQPAPAAGGGPIKASPLARRLAGEKGIDLAPIQGTGPGGRIEKDDVLRAAEASAARPSTPDDLAPLSTMRRAIARRVIRSKQEIPDFSVNMPMEMTVALKKKKELEAAGIRVSINDLVILAVSRVLPSHPDLNAQLEGDSLRPHREINIGLAVGADDGLYVPTIRNADRLSLEEIAAETRRLAVKAEQKQLNEADMAGGTFTVSNLGMFGVESFTAIIMPPQTAILSLGSVVDRAVRGEGDSVVWQPTMMATLTVDHRVVDGLSAARFLRDLNSQLMSF